MQPLLLPHWPAIPAAVSCQQQQGQRKPGKERAARGGNRSRCSGSRAPSPAPAHPAPCARTPFIFPPTKHAAPPPDSGCAAWGRGPGGRSRRGARRGARRPPAAHLRPAPRLIPQPEHARRRALSSDRPRSAAHGAMGRRRGPLLLAALVLLASPALGARDLRALFPKPVSAGAARGGARAGARPPPPRHGRRWLQLPPLAGRPLPPCAPQAKLPVPPQDKVAVPDMPGDMGIGCVAGFNECGGARGRWQRCCCLLLPPAAAAAAPRLRLTISPPHQPQVGGRGVRGGARLLPAARHAGRAVPEARPARRRRHRRQHVAGADVSLPGG